LVFESVPSTALGARLEFISTAGAA
jgi:hypothetical protein